MKFLRDLFYVGFFLMGLAFAAYLIYLTSPMTK